jgi:hypothetical protein
MRGLQVDADAGGVGTKLLERDATRRELMLPTLVDAATEEVLTEPEPRSKLEDDIDVRAGLTDGRDERRARSCTSDCAS